MARYSVIQTGGKQYLVKDDQTLTVQKINTENDSNEIACDVLMSFDDESGDLTLGAPTLKDKMNFEITSHIKGEKIRIAKFKSKVRYRRVTGFRPQLSTIKISTKKSK